MAGMAATARQMRNQVWTEYDLTTVHHSQRVRHILGHILYQSVFIAMTVRTGQTQNLSSVANAQLAQAIIPASVMFGIAYPRVDIESIKGE